MGNQLIGNLFRYKNEFKVFKRRSFHYIFYKKVTNVDHQVILCERLDMGRAIDQEILK